MNSCGLCPIQKVSPLTVVVLPVAAVPSCNFLNRVVVNTNFGFVGHKASPNESGSAKNRCDPCCQVNLWRPGEGERATSMEK